MPVKSLLELAQQAAIRSAKEIDNFGEIPHKLVKPVIAKIENPHQLHTIETNSPDFQGENNDKWTEFIKRDVPDWDQRPYYPRDGKSWYRAYRKLRRQAKKEAEESAKMLTAQLSEATALKAENVTRIDWNMKHSDRKVKKPAAAMNSWRKGPSYNHRMMITPTHSLNHKPKQVVEAPPSFVEEAKRKMLPQSQPSGRLPVPSTIVRSVTQSNPSGLNRPTSTYNTVSSRPRPVGSSTRRSQSQTSLSEREARLRALTSGRVEGTHSSSSVTASSGQPASRPRRNREHAPENGSSTSMRPPGLNSTAPSASNVEGSLSSPPRTPKRYRDEDQDHSSPEDFKRRRVEHNVHSDAPKNSAYDSHLDSRNLQRHRDHEQRSASGRKNVHEVDEASSDDETPKAPKILPGASRPRSRPSPLQPLMRKKRPVQK